MVAFIFDRKLQDIQRRNSTTIVPISTQ